MADRKATLGLVEEKRIFEILEEIGTARPGIRLLELEPGGLERARYIWDVDQLLRTFERDFRNMTREQREALEKSRFTWGYLEDGRVMVWPRTTPPGAPYMSFLEER